MAKTALRIVQWGLCWAAFRLFIAWPTPFLVIRPLMNFWLPYVGVYSETPGGWNTFKVNGIYHRAP